MARRWPEVHCPTRVMARVPYPEGPTPWRDGVLLVSYTDHAVLHVVGRSVRTVWQEPGVGPAAVAVAPDDTLWVTGYDTKALIQLDLEGREICRLIEVADTRLLGPNDLVCDEHGVWFTDSGSSFDRADKPEGRVLFFGPRSQGRVLASGLHYANGIAAHGDDLWVSEHFANRVVAVPRTGGSVRPVVSLPPDSHPRLGPDGIAIAEDGTLVAAHYGGKRLAVRRPDGSGSSVPIPLAYPTNVALEGTRAWVTAFASEEEPTGALLSVDLTRALS